MQPINPNTISNSFFTAENLIKHTSNALYIQIYNNNNKKNKNLPTNFYRIQINLTI